MLIDFKDEDFENKIKNEELSVIQFSASWCSPCKQLKPVMEKLSENYKKVKMLAEAQPPILFLPWHLWEVNVVFLEK